MHVSTTSCFRLSNGNRDKLCRHFRHSVLMCLKLALIVLETKKNVEKVEQGLF